MDMGPRVLNPSLACFPREDGMLRNVLLSVGQLSGGGRCTATWGLRPTGPGDTKQRPAPKGTGQGRQAISSKAVGPALYSRGNPCRSSQSRSPPRTHCTECELAQAPPAGSVSLFCLKNQLSNVLNKTFIYIMQGTNKYFNVIGRMQRIVKSYGSLTSDWPRLNKLGFDVL